jgi:hypothetical protein
MKHAAQLKTFSFKVLITNECIRDGETCKSKQINTRECGRIILEKQKMDVESYKSQVYEIKLRISKFASLRFAVPGIRTYYLHVTLFFKHVLYIYIYIYIYD